MVTTETDMVSPVRKDCLTPEDRARREAATWALFEARERSTDEDERQRLLEEIVELNIEIARGIGRRFRGRGAEDDDLEQVAYLGLLKAVHNFRLDHSTPFIGFAIPTIRGEVKRYFRDCSWTVRIPRRMQELQGMIAAAVPVLEQELNREPTLAEIADRIGVEVTEVNGAEAARGCFNVLSLDRPATESESPLGETVADDSDRRYFDQLEAVDMLGPVVEDLDPRDRRILELRFVEGWTQSDIGDDIGVSQMQISRLLNRILRDLRGKLNPMPSAA